jgi:hypothetical protein
LRRFVVLSTGQNQSCAANCWAKVKCPELYSQHQRSVCENRSESRYEGNNERRRPRFGQRNVGDSLRRRPFSGWRTVYYQQVHGASRYLHQAKSFGAAGVPRDTSRRALDGRWCPRVDTGSVNRDWIPDEDRGPVIGFHINRMHGRSTQSIDKMRRCLGGYVKSICNPRSSRGSNGSGSEQPVLWHMMASP